MTNKKWLFSLSSFLFSIGFCLILLTMGLFTYNYFQTWIINQPRAIASNHMIWPEVPPITPLPSPSPTSLPSPTPTIIPTPTPTPGPPIQVEIPKINVKRAVIPIDTITRNGQLEWDIEKLFATQNRHDLVGHLQGSTNPGQLGNIVLTGHNYNWGYYNWTGVFYSLNQLQKGDIVHLYSEEDRHYLYQVEQIEELIWQEGVVADIFSHIAFLSPTQNETLTLITCGGANLAPFPSRIYVRAKRIPTEE